MKMAFVSFEVAPISKVGGLADVAGSLPKYLKKNGVDVVIITPFHQLVRKNISKMNLEVEKVKENLTPKFHTIKDPFNVYKVIVPNMGVPIYLIENERFFSTDEVYDFPEEELQTAYFSESVLITIKDLIPDVELIHVNDWQTALIPVYMRTVYRDDPTLSKIASVLTIHNLGYQGVFKAEVLNKIGLPGFLYNIDALEFYRKINYLKGGIMFSDVITTVSKTYAEEIQTEEFGEKLEGVLRIRGSDLYGILNGIDYEIFDPQKDKYIPYNYSIDNPKERIKNKLFLQKRLGFEVDEKIPLIGAIGRMVEQKGFDLLVTIADYLALTDMQMVILGKGKEKYEKLAKNLENKYKRRISVNIAFDLELAQQIYAGVDVFLMPSRYEPCGLGQMYAMRYGAVPVVRYTGGLADTVSEYDERTKRGTGFGFYEFEEAQFLKAVMKALYYFKMKPDDWWTIVRNGMAQDFSWDRSAREYIQLYEIALSKKR